MGVLAPMQKQGVDDPPEEPQREGPHSDRLSLHLVFSTWTPDPPASHVANAHSARPGGLQVHKNVPDGREGWRKPRGAGRGRAWASRAWASSQTHICPANDGPRTVLEDCVAEPHTWNVRGSRITSHHFRRRVMSHP